MYRSLPYLALFRILNSLNDKIPTSILPTGKSPRLLHWNRRRSWEVGVLDSSGGCVYFRRCSSRASSWTRNTIALPVTSSTCTLLRRIGTSIAALHGTKVTDLWGCTDLIVIWGNVLLLLAFLQRWGCTISTVFRCNSVIPRLRGRRCMTNNRKEQQEERFGSHHDGSFREWIINLRSLL